MKKKLIRLILWYELVALVTVGVTIELLKSESQLGICLVAIATAGAMGVIHAVARHTETEEQKPQWNMLTWYLTVIPLTSWVTAWMMDWQFHYVTIFVMPFGLALIAAMAHWAIKPDDSNNFSETEPP